MKVYLLYRCRGVKPGSFTHAILKISISPGNPEKRNKFCISQYVFRYLSKYTII